MKKLIPLFTILICSTFIISAQEKAEIQFELKGVVKDKNSDVIIGLALEFKDKDFIVTTVTDLQGEFSLDLPPGTYEIKGRNIFSEKFIAFINIEKSGLNPKFVEFMFEYKPDYCESSNENRCPEILKEIKPFYPAAARAVRAIGEVIVEININGQGNVTFAQAISGHPLLRKASENAAEEFLFEPSETAERKANLIFVFLLHQQEKENLKRYSNPYRITIIGKEDVINNTIDTE